MNIFPVSRYEIKSTAKPAEIAELLSAHVQPYPIITRLGGHKSFSGSVSETGFHFIRVGRNRNNFRPSVSGTFLSSPQGTTIHITIKHDAFYFIPMAIMFLLFTLFFFRISITPFLIALSNNNSQVMQEYLSAPDIFFLLSPVIVLLMGYIVPWIFFETEANAAKKELDEILAPLIIK